MYPVQQGFGSSLGQIFQVEGSVLFFFGDFGAVVVEGGAQSKQAQEDDCKECISLVHAFGSPDLINGFLCVPILGNQAGYARKEYETIGATISLS